MTGALLVCWGYAEPGGGSCAERELQSLQKYAHSAPAKKQKNKPRGAFKPGECLDSDLAALEP